MKSRFGFTCNLSLSSPALGASEVRKGHLKRKNRNKTKRITWKGLSSLKTRNESLFEDSFSLTESGMDHSKHHTREISGSMKRRNPTQSDDFLKCTDQGSGRS